MADNRIPGWLLNGTHAALPAANTVMVGSLYACSDHGLIYQSDGTDWDEEWYDPSGAGVGSHVHSGADITSGTVAEAQIHADIARDSEVTSAVAAHTGDTTDAHDASAISADPTGLTYVTGTDVQTAIEELDAAVGTGGGGVTVQDEGTPLSTTATTLDFVGAGVTATGTGATKTITIPGGGGGGHAVFDYYAAWLEPLAIEQLRTGAYSYAVGSDPRLVINAFKSQRGGAGRWDVRDPRLPEIVIVKSETVTGLDSGSSTGAFIDSAAPTYADSYATYHDRLQYIMETTPKIWTQTAAATRKLFLPGPYGSLITDVAIHDMAWLVARQKVGTTDFGWNLSNEVGNAAGDYQRVAHGVWIPTHVNIVSALETGAGGSDGDDPEAMVAYHVLPETWGKVADANTYIFRDDFMGASLDTTTDWNRTVSTAGNIEIEPLFAWLKCKGNANWGDNTIITQTSTSRVAGKVLECYVYTGSFGAGAGMIGWHDGAGNSYTDLVHGLNFHSAGNIDVYEAGVQIGTDILTLRSQTVYRIRITLQSTGAVYEIQGGDHAALGSASWTTITPGTASGGTTTPLHGAVVMFDDVGAEDFYVGDFKMYS